MEKQIKNRNIKVLLKKSLQSDNLTINKTHLQYTLSLLRQEQVSKDRHERIKLSAFLTLQIKFIGWKIWLMQGLVLAMIFYFLTVIFGDAFDYNKRFAAVLTCSISIMVLMMAIPFIQRSLRYKMHETEMAAYFSSIKLLMAKLLIIGIGDIFILNGLLFLIVFKNYLNIGSALLYIIFPFLLTSWGFMYLLGHIPAQRFSPCCVCLCAILYICIALLNKFVPIVFQQTFSAAWAAVCLVLLILCLSQFRYIIYRSSYAQIQPE